MLRYMYPTLASLHRKQMGWLCMPSLPPTSTAPHDFYQVMICSKDMIPGGWHFVRGGDG